MKRITALLITAAMLLLVAVPAYADTSKPIYLQADKSTYSVGDTVKVDVMVKNASDVFGIELDMSYDTEYLSLKEDGVENVAWKDGFFQHNKLASGVRIVATKLGASGGINGNAKLFTFEFTALKNGDTTVELDNILVSNSAGVLLDMNGDADVTISIGTIVPNDKSALNAAIKKAMELKSSDYTKESWAKLDAALKKALEVQENTYVTQKEIDDATKDLLDAIDSLVKVEKPEEPGEPEEPGKADKSALKKAIEDAESFKESDYTEDSWDAFQKALAAAKQVMEDDDATQAEVDEALADLNASVKALVKKPGETPGEGDEDDEDEDDEEEESPQTGVEDNFLLFFVVLSAVSALALISIFVRKRTREIQ